MSEEAKEFIKKKYPNRYDLAPAGWTTEKVAEIMEAYKNQFPQEVSDESNLTRLIESLEELRENNLLKIFKQTNAFTINKLNKILFSEDGIFISYEFLEWIVCDDDLVIMPTEKDGWIWFSSKDARITRITTEQLHDFYLRSKLTGK